MSDTTESVNYLDEPEDVHLIRCHEAARAGDMKAASLHLSHAIDAHILAKHMALSKLPK